MENSPKIKSRTILFITGAFVSNECWDEWIKYFENKGYNCLAPPWPHKDASASVLRTLHPDKEIAAMRLRTLIAYYANLAKALPEKPILIGHSMGGLITQILLQRDIALAGVAIHPVAPQGVITFSWDMLKAVWGPLGYFTSVKKSFMMSFKQWQFAFTNGMPLDAQQETYNRLCIPESKLISRDGLTKVAKVNFTRHHPPLLITSGSEDHIVPAKLNYANYKKYNSFAQTDYKEFKGRNHFVLGQPTWKEDAEYIYNWLQK
jgi:pimeloyl-ACP methyl ester carboxylesterase